MRPEIVEWGSISPGVWLYCGGYVTHRGTIWKCVLSHYKSPEDEPGISSVWARGIKGGDRYG